MVLDPFAGTGTILAAAGLEGGRSGSIGIDAEYAATTRRRLAQAAAAA